MRLRSNSREERSKYRNNNLRHLINRMWLLEIIYQINVRMIEVINVIMMMLVVKVLKVNDQKV